MNEMITMLFLFFLSCILAYYVIFIDTSEEYKRLEKSIEDLRKLRDAALKRRIYK